MNKGQKMFGDGGVKFFCVANELSCPRSIRKWKFRGVKKCKGCKWKRSFSELSKEQKNKVKKDGKILWWGSFTIRDKPIPTRSIRFRQGELGFDNYNYLYKHCVDIKRIVSDYMDELVREHMRKEVKL
jgi:hypothetical protein